MSGNFPPLDNHEQARLLKQAAGFEKKFQSLLWQLGQLMRVVSGPQGRKGGLALFKAYSSYYIPANQPQAGGEINVELPIDAKIPFEAKAAKTYISHVALAAAAYNFLKKEFGSRADADLEKFLQGTAGLFPEATEVFKNAQTSFVRTGKGGFGIWLLRLIDNNKNASPSLHIEIVAHTYNSLSKIINVHAGEPLLYKPIKQAFFKKSVNIFEAVLLVKQHVVMDIALGLALLQSREPDFTGEQAEAMVNAMFKDDGHGMDAATISELREKTIFIYREAKNRITAKKQTSAAQALVEYLKSNVKGDL